MRLEEPKINPLPPGAKIKKTVDRLGFWPRLSVSLPP